ncbi:MAG TPA: HEAT repeat domain-containing protein [Steroidobacteraceae bacterium]|nr:HEAT repeat domain-containing protein [Steroidobacteraceae bacterium]
MKHTLTTLAALIAMSGAALAQTPAEKPAKPAKPPQAASAPASRAKAGEPGGDEELAIAALEGLMAQPAERALPILKKVLAGSQTTRVKQRALFVLSQIDSAEARQVLAQTSRSSDAAMRGEAIRAIGIGGDPKSLDALKEIYDTGSADVKQEVLQAWLISDHKEAVYQVALNAKTEDEANAAIRMLGAMGASEELRKLGDRPNASRGLVEAFAISGDLASLRKIAEGNGDREVRLDAIRKIGIVDSDAARTALRDIYTRSTDAGIKDAALQGMLIADDDEGVLALYRAAKTPDEKRALMRMLSTMDGEAALQAIDAALEDRK